MRVIETDARRDARSTQAELGDIVYVELPEVGSKVEAKSSFGVVESVKAASDVYSPVSGEVIAVNESLNDTPGLVNESSYGDGWLMKVKMSNKDELNSMMDAAAYEASWYVHSSLRRESFKKRVSAYLNCTFAALASVPSISRLTFTTLRSLALAANKLSLGLAASGTSPSAVGLVGWSLA